MVSSSKCWIDANVILRYIAKDDKRLAPIAEKFFNEIVEENSIGYVNTLVLHEVIYVLEKIYKKSRKAIVSSISSLVSMDGINIVDLDKNNLTLALKDYLLTNVDFPDCVYKQIALANDYTICSFDKDFKKLKILVKST